MTKKHPLFGSRAVLLLALAALAGGAYFWRSQGQSAPAPAAKPASGGYQPTKEQWAGLKVAEVKLASFRDTLVTDGNIAFNDEALTPVFSPYSGRVSRLIAKPGDRVNKGAPLLAVEASEFVQGKNDLAVARANVDAARAAEKRQHELFTAGAGSQKDWQAAQASLAGAEAALTAARGRLSILGKSEAELDALEKSSAGGTEAVVLSPIAGTVIQRQVGLGQYITSASGGAANPVYTVGNLSTVWLVANVRESDAPRMKAGEPVEVRVPAMPDKTFQAKLTWVASSLDAVTHRLPVRAEVANPTGELKPQMFANFAISSGPAAQAPAVPQGALVYEGDATRVFVVAANGAISGREVRVGRNRDGLAEVLSGLKPGEKVISAGTLFIDRALEGY